jgi:uncharacterized protein YdeI (YjbR/CyaY-like superfamily)
MKTLNPKVDAFISGAEKWQEEYKELRSIVLDCGLDEELKWGVPCYTVDNKNVVLVNGFKEYCAILFVKGALLKDERGILVTQTENVQSSRQVRFTRADEIVELGPVLKAYILEAVELEKSGAKVDFKKTAEFNMPVEFKKMLDGDAALKAAFEALTPGRQRAYLLFFSAPKQARTREARIEKSIPQILVGKGLND